MRQRSGVAADMVTDKPKEKRVRERRLESLVDAMSFVDMSE
jgi:hypothetical protein